MLITVLRRRLKPYRWRVVLLLALQAVQTLTTLLLPTLNASIIDNGVVKGDTRYIIESGAVMLAMTIGQISAALAANYLSAQVAFAVARDLRSAVFHQVVSFSSREIGTFGTPSLITRTITDVQQVQSLLLAAFTVLVITPIMGIGAIVLALRQDIPMAMVLLAIVPVVTIAITLVLVRMSPLYNRTQLLIDRINHVVGEQIAGVRVVRAFVRDSYERQRLGRANSELFTASLGVTRLVAMMFPLLLLVINTFGVVLVWIGGHRADSGAVGVGTLSAFLTYLDLIIVSIIMAMGVILSWPKALVSARRIQAVLDTTSTVRPPVRPARTALSGRLELSEVDFRYPGAELPVLRGVDLVAESGQTLALIGSTGSGKTTLLNLVLRQADVTAGRVLVNGTDVRGLSAAQLGKAVGFVPQKSYLFSGTIASNLRFGCPQATDAELWHALEVVQLTDFVERLPDTLDTPVSQGGTTLSGGQRQRLAIARTLLRKPEIYLFDDCFSALDARTNAALRSALAKETSSAAVVVASQRISSVRHADRVIVLDAGQVAGTGSHSELLRDNKIYREIAMSETPEWTP